MTFEEHKNIRVSDNRVYVKKDDGIIEEYVLVADDGQLCPLPSPLVEVAAKIIKIEPDIFATKVKLGAKQAGSGRLFVKILLIPQTLNTYHIAG